MKAGKHGYSGSCAPGSVEHYGSQATFSVGIFEWLPTANGKGLKKSAVKVRVKGYVSQEPYVYGRALDICHELDAGIYTGPKNVIVKP